MTKAHNIVLIPYPFTENPQIKKVRPAVVLTKPIGKHQHVIVAFISSKHASRTNKHVLHISKKDPGFSQTGLKVSSTIILHKLTTIPQNYIHRLLGTTTAKQSAQIKAILLELCNQSPKPQQSMRATQGCSMQSQPSHFNEGQTPPDYCRH